jgi:phosphate-selective porin
MRKIIALIMACALLGGCSATQTTAPSTTPQVESVTEINTPYENIEDTFATTMHSKGYGNFKIYEPSNLTSKILENRTEDDVLIIERCVGEVINDKGDGKVLNVSNQWNYICYEGHLPEESEKAGTKVVTYLVYNPDTNYTDDVMERYDYVVSEMETLR